MKTEPQVGHLQHAADASRRRLLGWAVLGSTALLTACGSQPRTASSRSSGSRTPHSHRTAQRGQRAHSLG